MCKKIEYIAHRREKDGKIQSLIDHLEEVSKLTGEFASKIGLKKQGELIGLLHDFGKYSKEFQGYIQSATGMLNPDEDEDYVDAQELKGLPFHVLPQTGKNNQQGAAMETRIAIFKGSKIRKTLHNNEWWFVINDVVGLG